jgi:hypothetical protein
MAPAESGTVPGEIIGELGTSPLTTELLARDGPPATTRTKPRIFILKIKYFILSISWQNAITHSIWTGVNDRLYTLLLMYAELERHN